jgi:hypothetical protein
MDEVHEGNLAESMKKLPYYKEAPHGSTHNGSTNILARAPPASSKNKSI